MAVSLLDALPWRISGAVERCLQPTVADNSVHIEHCEDAERLVIVLGWGGALQKHLAKLRNFYLSERYIVISYISPMSCFFDHGLIESDIEELSRSLHQELIRVRRKTFHVHLHSNNGTFVWGSLMLALRESSPDTFSALTGIVLDSAPRVGLKPPSLISQALGFTFACIPIMLRRNQYVHIIWTPALFFFLLFKFLTMYLKVPTHRRFMFDAIQNAVVLNMPVDVPQLYIYSTKDLLISSHAVEEYIAGQRKRGMAVSVKRFSDTPHVQHFLRKEVEYKEALRSFLEKS